MDITYNTPGTRLQSLQFHTLAISLLAITSLAVLLQFAGYPSLFTASISTLALIAQVILFALLQRRFFFISFLVTFAFVAATVSCLVIESGAYLTETHQQGFVNGATARHALLCMLFLYASSFTFSTTGRQTEEYFRSSRQPSQILELLLYLCLGIVLSYLLFVVLKFGSALSPGLGKHVYLNEIAPSLLKQLYPYVPQLNFLLGIQYVLSRDRVAGNTKIPFTIFLSSLLLLALIGFKFSMLFLTAFFFVVPAFILRKPGAAENISTLQFFGLFFSFILFSLPLILFHYMFNTGDISDALEQLRDRAALQGQIWWIADQFLIQWGHRSFQEFLDLIMRTDGINGMKYMMTKVLPRDVLIFYFDRGVVLSMGFPAILPVIFGWMIGGVVVIACGVIFGMTSKMLLFGILSRNVLFAFVTMKLYLATYVAFVPGEIDVLFSWKFFLYLFVSIFILNLYRSESTSMLRILDGNWISRKFRHYS